MRPGAQLRSQLEVLRHAATRSVAEKEDELRRLQAENAELQEMLASLAARASVSDRRNRVDSLNHRLIQVKAELDAVEAQRVTLHKQLDLANAEKEKTERKLGKAASVAQSLEAELVTSTDEAVELERRLKALEDELKQPLPASGESETARRLYMNLGTVQEERERLRMTLRAAKQDCDLKKTQLLELHRRLRMAQQSLAQRDAQLQAAQRRSAMLLANAVSSSRGGVDSVQDALAAADAKDQEIAILTAKANETDRLVDELLEFVKSCAPKRYLEELPAAHASAPEPVVPRQGYDPAAMFVGDDAFMAQAQALESELAHTKGGIRRAMNYE